MNPVKIKAEKRITPLILPETIPKTTHHPKSKNNSFTSNVRILSVKNDQGTACFIGDVPHWAKNIVNNNSEFKYKAGILAYYDENDLICQAEKCLNEICEIHAVIQKYNFTNNNNDKIFVNNCVASKIKKLT